MSTPGVPGAQQIQQTASVPAGPNTAQPGTQGTSLLQQQVSQPSSAQPPQVPSSQAVNNGQPSAAGNAVPTVGPAVTSMPSSIPAASSLPAPLATPVIQQNPAQQQSSPANVPPHIPAGTAMPNPGLSQNTPATVPTNPLPAAAMQQAAPTNLQQPPTAENPAAVQQQMSASTGQPMRQAQQEIPAQSTPNLTAPQTTPVQQLPNQMPPASTQPIGNQQQFIPALMQQPAVQPVLAPSQPVAPVIPSNVFQQSQPVSMPMMQQQVPQQVAPQAVPGAAHASLPGNTLQSAATSGNHSIAPQNSSMPAATMQHPQPNLQGGNGIPAVMPTVVQTPTEVVAQPTVPAGNAAALPDLAAAAAAASGTIPNLASQMFQAVQNGSLPIAMPVRVTGRIERVDSQEIVDSDDNTAKHHRQGGKKQKKERKQAANKGNSSEEEEYQHDDRNRKDNRQQGQQGARTSAKPAKEAKDGSRKTVQKPGRNYPEDDQESYQPEDVVYSDYDERDDIRPKARDTQHRQRDKYEGDISTWGHKKMPPGFFSKKPTSESDYTMSSGLSPRDTRPRPREFDVEAAKNTLAYSVGMYGRAQAMRREGTAPAAMGVADDLPTRMAYEQLNALSGMANKVQLAIDHNKRVFEARMKMEDTALTRKSFNAWRAARYGSVAKQQILLRACARIQRGTLARAFAAWKDKFHQVDQDLAMRRKVSAVNARGRLRRAFMEWRRLAQERWWKNQYSMRDEQIHALERRIAGYERRPIMVLRKRKLSAVLNAWYNLSEGRRKRRQRFNKAGRYFQNQALGKCWNSWLDFCAEKARRRGLLTKAGLRMRNLQLTNAWNTWYDLFLDRREKQAKQNKCLRHWFNAQLNKAWQSWLHHVEWRKEKRAIMSRWQHPLLAKAFSGWSENVAWQKRMRLILKRAAGRLMNKTLGAAFLSWQAAVEDSKMGEELNTKDQLLIKVKEMQEENERLRRDNERFVRLIDSGEWGRGRVAELVSAGEVLKGERDALLRLIQSMRKEYEAVQQAKVTQEDEMKALKDRMLLGGAARNKMLVKGASSFNALVRAMKQDLVEGGMGNTAATARNPNALYEIDKLSLDRVTVFPDGELNVEAVASMPATAAFSRPLSAGRAVRGNATTLGPNMAPPLQPVRMPQELIGSQHAASMGPRPTSGPAGRSTGRFSGVPGKIASSGGTISKDYQRVLDALQSLTPAEVDKLENLVKQQAGVQGVGPVPPGMHATSAPGSPGPHNTAYAPVRR